MKKIIALLLAMAMVFAFAACGSTNDEAQTNDTPATEAPETETPETEAPELEDEDNEPATGSDIADEEETEEPSEDVDDQPATMPEDNAGNDQPAEMPEQPEQPEQNGSGDSSASSEAVLNELYAMIDSINAGVELPMVGSMALDAEMFPYYAFIDKPAGVEAVVSEAMIGSIAHSLVLFKCADGVDVNAIASQVQSNANPRKWICVEAEKTVVVVKGSYILLVMSNEVAADALVSNFNSL